MYFFFFFFLKVSESNHRIFPKIYEIDLFVWNVQTHEIRCWVLEPLLRPDEATLRDDEECLTGQHQKINLWLASLDALNLESLVSDIQAPVRKYLLLIRCVECTCEWGKPVEFKLVLRVLQDKAIDTLVVGYRTRQQEVIELCHQKNLVLVVDCQVSIATLNADLLLLLPRELPRAHIEPVPLQLVLVDFLVG